MNKASFISAALAIAWLLSPCASGLELPNDTDLKVAYCAGMTAARIASMKGVLSVLEQIDHPDPRAMADKMRKRISEAEQLAARFDRYLNPRLRYLDQAPLAQAAYQAADDAKRYYGFGGDPNAKSRSDELSDECFPECKKASKSKLWACYKSCVQRDELGARALRCEEPQFLPF
jgi:hypothetical protein